MGIPLGGEPGLGGAEGADGAVAVEHLRVRLRAGALVRDAEVEQSGLGGRGRWRHGEACGQKWTHTPLDAGLIAVAKQLVVDGWEVYEDAPRTGAGARTIALDSDTVEVLRRHRAQRGADREKWDTASVESIVDWFDGRAEVLVYAPVSR